MGKTHQPLLVPAWSWKTFSYEEGKINEVVMQMSRCHADPAGRRRPQVGTKVGEGRSPQPDEICPTTWSQKVTAWVGLDSPCSPSAAQIPVFPRGTKVKPCEDKQMDGFECMEMSGRMDNRLVNRDGTSWMESLVQVVHV